MNWFSRKKKPEFSYISIHPTLPVAPQIQLEVRAPRNEALEVSVTAILDSGADQTCLPEQVFSQFDERYLDYCIVPVSGAVGEAVDRKAYIMHLQFAGCNLANIQVISLESGIALIGRDILNKHKVTLDGPNNKWVMESNC